jgi:uncharacterized protein YndB with AHSA1/START domain
MGDDAFWYISHIKTTQERLWQALIEPETTKRYWGVSFDTDWAPGSAMAWVEEGGTITDSDQRVLVFDPMRRLSYTWHAFTPEWAARAGIDEGTRSAMAAEPRSKVAFDLEAAKQIVKLTVTHDGFEPGSTVLKMVREVWPQIISSLKTLMETGQPLPD